jgi:hypothetical protein
MFRVVLSLAAALAVAGVSSAQQAAPAADDREARATLERMARFVASAQKLSVTLETAYDVLQPDGQKIEFGARRRVALRRPDRFRMDAEERDGSRRGIMFDGKEIYAFDLDENVYASVAKPGTADQALDHATGELGLRIPLSDLFASDLPQTVAKSKEVSLVAEEKLRDVSCEHIAVRADEVDYEVWVATGEQPLPQRIVVTYKLAPGQPRFVASLSDWNLAPDLPDALFTYEPAADAERIRVAPVAEGAQR